MTRRDILKAGAAAVCTGTIAPGAETSRYVPLLTSHLGALAKHGTDRYGPVETPMYTMAERLPPWMVWIKTAFSVSPEATARAVSRFARTRRRKR